MYVSHSTWSTSRLLVEPPQASQFLSASRRTFSGRSIVEHRWVNNSSSPASPWCFLDGGLVVEHWRMGSSTSPVCPRTKSSPSGLATTMVGLANCWLHCVQILSRWGWVAPQPVSTAGSPHRPHLRVQVAIPAVVASKQAATTRQHMTLSLSHGQRHACTRSTAADSTKAPQEGQPESGTYAPTFHGSHGAGIPLANWLTRPSSSKEMSRYHTSATLARKSARVLTG